MSSLVDLKAILSTDRKRWTENTSLGALSSSVILKAVKQNVDALREINGTLVLSNKNYRGFIQLN